MAITLILWGHALAALLFGALALAEWRSRAGAGPALAIAAGLTALWALAVAGVGTADGATHLAQSARSIAWLCVIVTLARRQGGAGRTVLILAGVVGVVSVIEALVSIAADLPLPGDVRMTLGATRALLAAMTTTGALIVLSHFAQTPDVMRRGAARLLVLALALLWGSDLFVAGAGALSPDLIGVATLVRGPMAIGVALLLAVARVDRGIGPAVLSRPLALRLLALAAVIAGVAVIVLATSGIAVIVGGEARAARTVVIVAVAAALLAFAATPWLRAWTRVKVAKHLFGHRYDYRVEWQRFTGRLGLPGQGGDALATRVVQAMAELTDSPAGLLLAMQGDRMAAAGGWRWPAAAGQADAAFAAHLGTTGRILSLDGLRDDPASPEAALLPEWLTAAADAWAVVPLIHGGTLIAAIVLTRPPIDRALDWEDFDLLRVAGRQAASYLAEEQAHAALAEAQRFDEFNRRFAFVLHDIKNVASQLTLVARNAERHAGNPDFRADMMATLRDSAARMTTLLARLGQHDAGRAEPLQPVDLAALASRLASLRRTQHPVVVDAPSPCRAVAHPQRLEQALAHLIQNAIEASAPERPVRLTLIDQGERVAIEVRDDGRGMTAGFVRDELFRPFASSKPNGFGIGAFEARQLVGGMGGALEVDSREGDGSVFRILLPAAPIIAPSMEDAA